MGSVLSAMNSSSNERRDLIKLRQEAHQRKCREIISSELEAIEVNKLHDHDPIHPSRPYGLPEELAGAREDVWDLVFQHVNEVETIASLMQVCQLFKNLLKQKYVEVRLPEIVAKCLERKIIPWSGRRIKENNWVKTMSSLRIISRASKKVVDRQFDRGLLGEEYGSHSWIPKTHPGTLGLCRKIPSLRLGGLDVEQRRLRQALKYVEDHGVPKNLRAITFYEYSANYEIPPNLPLILDQLHSLVEKVGTRIISFRCSAWYMDNNFDAYNNLRRIVTLMPNLEELMIDTFEGDAEADGEANGIVVPFPVCKNLKRYSEGCIGPRFRYLKEILTANPTIEGVQLGEMLAIETEAENIMGLLDTLHLKSFYICCIPVQPFFVHEFPWTLTLKSLFISDTQQYKDASSKTLFTFISKFKNLQELYVMSYRTRDKGGYLLDLPKLEIVYWSLGHYFKSLEFLRHVEGLRLLGLDVLDSWLETRGRNDILAFLEKWNVPTLFPDLKEIKFQRNGGRKYKTVWKAGTAV